MAKFKARNLSRSDINLLIAAMRRRNNEFLKTLEIEGARALLHGCQIIEARAKEILTEKGHVVTGNLRRSINSRVRLEGDKIVGEVGSFLVYAPAVEALPEGPARPRTRGPRGGIRPGRGKGGGYLFPASEEKFQEVTDIMAREGLAVAIRNWGR